MSKRLGILFLCIVLACSAVTGTALAAGTDPADIYIDDNLVGSPGSALLIDSVVYVPLRLVCDYYGAVVSWTNRTNTASIILNGTTIEAVLWSRYITANGRIIYDDCPSVLVDNRLMLPARQLARALNATSSWNEADKSVHFYSGSEPIESGDSFYDSDDLYWLSRIIQAEAGSESLDGKIAVGNVVINRMESSLFPNTIYKVIFDRSSGVQFSPTANGAIYNRPSAESVLAAKLALEGVDMAGDALFFQNTAITGSNWMSRNRQAIATLGNHTFYA